ncbi:MAG: DNA-3-methyladenine glycosylase I, partial [Pseudomonadota bacterium]
ALEKASNDYAATRLKDIPDDRWLSTMAKCIFNAGFNWKVIDAKWPGFEEAFEGFVPSKLTFMGEEMMDRLVSDERIVRNGQKIKATLENAALVQNVSAEHGNFGTFLANWPADDQIGLMAYLNKHGSRLGGATAQYFLRFGGWDGWIASGDVCKALVREGVLSKPEAKTKKDLAAVQAAFNTLHEQSGQPRAVLSRLLALSVG